MSISRFFTAEKYSHLAIVKAALHHDGFWGTMPVKPIPVYDPANAKVKFDVSTQILTIEGITSQDETNGNWYVPDLDPITTEYCLCVHEGNLTGKFRLRAVRMGPVYDTLILIIRPS